MLEQLKKTKMFEGLTKKFLKRSNLFQRSKNMNPIQLLSKKIRLRTMICSSF